ncbi:hypothetical protein R6Q57_000450 [Mikania cordata]
MRHDRHGTTTSQVVKPLLGFTKTTHTSSPLPSCITNRSLHPKSSALHQPPAPPGDWSSLHKLAVCCPGLVHSSVLLENSDFRLEHDLDPDENYLEVNMFQVSNSQSNVSNPSCSTDDDDKV